MADSSSPWFERVRNRARRVSGEALLGRLRARPEGRAVLRHVREVASRFQHEIDFVRAALASPAQARLPVHDDLVEMKRHLDEIAAGRDANRS
jgi:hypothetical protein